MKNGDCSSAIAVLSLMWQEESLEPKRRDVLLQGDNMSYVCQRLSQNISVVNYRCTEASVDVIANDVARKLMQVDSSFVVHALVDAVA